MHLRNQVPEMIYGSGTPSSLDKVELIQVHLTLFKCRQVMEGINGSNQYLEQYNELGILPTHIDREKGAHTEAVTLLRKGVLEALKSNPIVREKLESMPTRLLRLIDEW